MMEENSFKFACPHCGQHIKADVNMVGMDADCPACGQPLKVPANGGASHEDGALCESHEPNHLPVPPSEEARATPPAPPVVKVIKRRERFIDKCKKRIKTVGIGVVVLVLFVGVAVIKFGNTPREAASMHKDTVKILEILEKYEAARRKRAQSHSTERENVRMQKANEETHSNYQREVEKPTKEFSGRISRIDDDCVVIVRDFSKSGVFFGIERKVRLDGITITDKTGAKDFVRRRSSGEVRVTYKDMDEAKHVKGTIWEDGGSGIKVRNIWTGEVVTKSLNDILVDEGYASYDKQSR